MVEIEEIHQCDNININIPKRAPAGDAPPAASTAKYNTFPTFQVDMGSFDTPYISIYLPLNGIGKHDRSLIRCDFKPTSFDLIVEDFDSKSYRMKNEGLYKEIVSDKSKYVVKPNKIIIKLAKKEGKMPPGDPLLTGGRALPYEHWAVLNANEAQTRMRRGGKAQDEMDTTASAEQEEKTDGGPARPPPPAHYSAPQPIPQRTPASGVPPSSGRVKYITFPTFQVDLGTFTPAGYASPTLSVYLPLDGIGKHDRSLIKCDFTPESFDLIVNDFESKNYRMINDNMDKDIDPDRSKILVKPNKIIIKLARIKLDEDQYEPWASFNSKKAKKKFSRSELAAIMKRAGELK